MCVEGMCTTIQQNKACSQDEPHHIPLQNEKAWGGYTLPLPKDLVHLFGWMEKAHQILGPKCPTLFMHKGKAPFNEDTISQEAIWLLSIREVHVCALDMRHEWITTHNDFKASNQGLFGVGTTLDEAIAKFLGNSPPTWAKAYDSKAHMRPMEEVVKHYSHFKEWVKGEAKRAKSKRARNPLSE